jgi:hypothetical protein
VPQAAVAASCILPITASAAPRVRSLAEHLTFNLQARIAFEDITPRVAEIAAETYLRKAALAQ